MASDPIASLSADKARERLRQIRSILWPDDDPEAQWSPDHLDSIALAIEDLCPNGGERPDFESVRQELAAEIAEALVEHWGREHNVSVWEAESPEEDRLSEEAQDVFGEYYAIAERTISNVLEA